MQNFIKKFLAGAGLFLIVLTVATIIDRTSYQDIGKQSAAVLDVLPVTADPASGFAWNDNVGWINFGEGSEQVEGRVYVSNNELYGYAWGENIGWISLNCANSDGDDCDTYSVTQDDSDGNLTGYAWGENIGWIDFAPAGGGVSISTSTSGTNTFSGYAWGENIGWISFSGTADDTSTYGVTTTWTAPEILISDISPSNFEIAKNATTTFSATVTGRNNTEVIWSVDETAGTIDENGLYTAGITPGDYTLTATASVDSSVSTTTTITVRGSGSSLPSCTYSYSEWSRCINNEQIRTAEPDPGTCINSSESLTQSCEPISISISPASSTIYVGETIQFTTTVTGSTTNDGVTWILTAEEDKTSGSLSENGLYIAPQTAGVFNIMVRPQADTTISAIAIVNVRIKPVITCTGYTYSSWSTCINSTQTRTTLTSIPPKCIGGITATTTQACVMPLPATTTPIVACTGYTYSDWSDCFNNAKTRTTLSSIPENCVGGATPVNRESCKTVPPDQETKNNSGRSSTSNNNDDKVVPLVNLTNFVSDNVAVLGTTTEKIVLGAQKVLESKTGDIVAKTITTAGVVGGGIAATSVFVLNGTMVTDLLFLPFKLWGLLLSVLGLKKRNRPWGTVYDSVTKQPIDPAYVTLRNLSGKKETTSITDLDGRYGFMVTPGKYILRANKTNYSFPSKKLLGKTTDILYSDLYFGEEIDITTNSTLISKNIPLDPIKFDWNEFVKGEKKLMKFYSKREKIIRIVTDWIFRLGFIVSLISLVLVSAPYNYIIFALYILLVLLRKFGLKQRALGSLTDKHGDPLSYAIIRVFSSDLNVEITNKVADKIGRYYCLVTKGKYYVKIEKKNDDESYTLVHTSPVFEADSGIINQNFSIK